jgi:hypothetical protein
MEFAPLVTPYARTVSVGTRIHGMPAERRLCLRLAFDESLTLRKHTD